MASEGAADASVANPVPAKAARPANGRGQGRKALQEGAASLVVPLRMTAEQKAKLQRLGGAAWIRQRIDKAREPPPIKETPAAPP